MKVGASHARTDPGRKRRGNEDSYVCQPPLFAIADGMGGARAGEVASALAAGALKESRLDGGGEARVIALIQEANRRVHQRASTDAATSGMGTTITVALVEPDGTVTFGHVGDSRAYLLRDGRLEQLTDDHSLVAELVRRGELSPREAEMHPQRSVITRALGTDPDVDVDAFPVRAKPGDLYLICSDGLSDMVDGEVLEQILIRHRDDLPVVTKALIGAANRGGGDDNITAVVFEIVDGEPGPSEPDERTREYAGEPDEDDTLHPEDGVQPPPAPPPADPGDTLVVPAEEIRAAVAGSRAAAPPAERLPAQPEAGLGRRLLALTVIAALVAVIVVLVWWGLAR
ncbi:MAG TPA: Stp1/IreP family PP2C-type Ser/Thr phosphatase [Gaiellaceae bacterium]